MVVAELPVNTTVLPAGLRPPEAVSVQFRPVRKVPARVSVPDGSLMSTLGRAPTVVLWKPLKIWAPLPLISRVVVPPPVKPIWALMSPWAARVPVLTVPLNRFSEPDTVRTVRGAMVIVPPRISTALRV